MCVRAMVVVLCVYVRVCVSVCAMKHKRFGEHYDATTGSGREGGTILLKKELEAALGLLVAGPCEVGQCLECLWLVHCKLRKNLSVQFNISLH
jgi:hypothetical protein